jgi:hypothetical protein
MKRAEGSVMTLKTIFHKPVDRPIEGSSKLTMRPVFASKLKNMF